MEDNERRRKIRQRLLIRKAIDQHLVITRWDIVKWVIISKIRKLWRIVW